MINRSGAMAVYLEVGSRSPVDVTTCSDIDMMSPSGDGRFVHKDGTAISRNVERFSQHHGRHRRARSSASGRPIVLFV